TYWQMKKRAGTVGQNGLGPLIGKLAATQSSLRVHLMGHSFGARLVSFAIKGLPADALKPASTLKSVSLLQGAFSHFAFTDSLPMHPGQQGALAGALQRIDGPLVATYSVHDMAVGWLYPMASLASGDNASALQDQLYEWGAMGHDGAQAVHATDVPIATVGQKYAFGTGACNLNGNNIIVQGGPPSGAHGDIFHPEIAWAVLTAAGVTKVSS
ncbi:MAG TPA: serine/threonine protein kinase, partial [Chloroflexota bacterium]